MRRTLRLLAAVKPARYLEAGTPTGLTGLYTHNSPRSTLLYLYSRTLEQLQRFPESSLYRQSVEALTKHRMAIVEAAEPPGYEAWAARARKIAEENPEQFRVAITAEAAKGRVGRLSDRADVLRVQSNGRVFVHRQDPAFTDVREQEWDGERDLGPGTEGLKGTEDRGDHESLFDRPPTDAPNTIFWEPEPQLTLDQIEEIENKIGSGLIEEVIQVAEGELKLVDILYENKVWEDLEEKPAEGQWTYFERGAQ
ncbi:hypothetical protein AAE478_000473 [Parahypoxylon ruwenzoriense]